MQMIFHLIKEHLILTLPLDLRNLTMPFRITSYPLPENPLELPEKSSQSEALDLGLVDDAVAPLALYGAPAQPFELPPDTLPTAAPEEFEELPLAQYLPPATAPRQRRGQRFGRLGRRGRRRGGQRRKRLIRTVRLL